MYSKVKAYMKKTLSVNLGGSVFHIDEDAYSELMDYLQDVKKHLGEDASSEEVLNDIEQRINELFSQWMQGQREVVTSADVQKVIGILGRPEQFNDEEEQSAERSDQKKESTTGRSEERGGQHQRLYRDPENAILGGVCSGLGFYLKVSPVLLRILFFLLVWFGGTGLFVYLVCWIIMPEAKTASQRLEMQGEDVNIGNIEKKIREESEKVKERVDGYVKSNQFQKNVHSVSNGFVEVLRVIFKIFFAFIAGVIGLAALFALIVLVTVLIALVTGSFSFLIPWIGEAFPYQAAMMNTSSAVWMIIGMVLIIGIPFIAIFRMLFGKLLDFKSASKWEVWVGLIGWFIGVGLCVFAGLTSLNQAGGVWI